MKLLRFLSYLLMVTLFLAACTPTLTPTAAPAVSPTAPASGGATDTPVVNTPEPTLPPKVQWPPAVEVTREKAAQMLNLPADALEIVKAEEVEWPNGCLGVDRPGQMCTMMITPGYRVVVSVQGQQFEFHADKMGKAVVPAFEILSWHQEGGIAGFCGDLIITPDGWAYATSCRSNPAEAIGSLKLSAEELEQLRGWQAKFASFEYQHDDNVAADGMLTRAIFTGLGSSTAAAADQEQIAAFAQELFPRIQQSGQ